MATPLLEGHTLLLMATPLPLDDHTYLDGHTPTLDGRTSTLDGHTPILEGHTLP